MTDQSTIDTTLDSEDRRRLRAAAIAMQAFVDDDELAGRLGAAFDLADEDLVQLVTDGIEHVRPRIEAAFELVRDHARELIDGYRQVLDRLAATAAAAGWPMDRECGDEA